MPTITLTPSGFSFSGPMDPKGHFKVNVGDSDVEFILAPDWNGEVPVTVTLPGNIFANETVTVGSSTTPTNAPLKSSPSGKGIISCADSDISVGTMQGQIDVVPKGGGVED